MLPRRRPVIPPAQRAPARSAFRIAAGYPRRGWGDAVVWPDTGVLLALGTDQDLLDRFCQHYRGRMRLTVRVARELRAHAGADLGPNAPDDDYDRQAAAELAVQALLVGARTPPLAELQASDLTEVDRVTQQLRAIGDSASKSHGGEAEIIVLAAQKAETERRKQVLLSNDGGASIVADRYGIPTRHIGDVLAEFACMDPDLAPETCLAAFRAALRVSAPPGHCRQADAGGFSCAATSSGCATCDAIQAKELY
jgi:hypothetical protein